MHNNTPKGETGELPLQDNETQMSESFRIGALLAVSGGILDSYTFICRGGVFANAQTGNIVLIGVNIAGCEWGGVLSAFIPVIAYMAGIMTTEAIRSRFKNKGSRVFHWRHGMLLTEIILLAVTMFIPHGESDHLANVMISFVCAVQVQTFRKIHGYPFASTMCTGNLRSGTEALLSYIRNGDVKDIKKCLYLYGIITFFITGATIGAAVSLVIPPCAVAAAIAAHCTAFIIMIRRGKKGAYLRDKRMN